MFALSPQLSCEGSEAVSSIGFVSSRKREHLKGGFGFWALHLPCPTLVNSDSDVLREKASLLRFDGKEVDSSDMRNSGLRLRTRSAFTVMNPPISWWSSAPFAWLSVHVRRGWLFELSPSFGL